MEFINNMMGKAARARKDAEKKNDEIYKKASASKLSKNMEKKIRTTFIGAINTIEKFFGEAWGQGKDYNELTTDEKRSRRAWDACRKEILDKGNNELRAAKSEVGEYTIEWNRFHISLGGNNERN